MFVKIVKIVIAFAVALWLANFLFSPSVNAPVRVSDKGTKTLFEKDLQKSLKQGQLVIVDKDETDKYIQEDLSSHDLTKALTFARYKSEVLEQPLYIENAATFGKANSLAKVDPTDRTAWQHLILCEIDLKEAYSRKHPGDLTGYQAESALDTKRTPDMMVEFISTYPDSYVIPTALSHIEYALCLAKPHNCDRAIAIYNKLNSKFKDKENLCRLLAEYRQRAMDYKTQYQIEADNAKAGS